MKLKMLIAVLLIFTGAASLLAVMVLPQGARTHTITRSGKLRYVASNSTPRQENLVQIEVQGDDRIIRSNGIPEHKTGSFPNAGNPHRISSQQYTYRIPANPQPAGSVTPNNGVFGVAINGVPFDPGAAEFYVGQVGTQWQYEPLSGAIALGIDVSHAHVQPNGAYHYHGLPTGLLADVNLTSKSHSPLVGWAADGYPIYAVFGYENPEDFESKIVAMKSSYRLKPGNRPGGSEPSGRYDGTFVGDYEYVSGLGDLDQCNGRFTVTPEFPQGTYAYFLTEDWPVIPRSFRGSPSSDFAKGPPGGGPGSMREGMRGRGFGPPGFGPPGSQPPRNRPPVRRRYED